MLCELCELVEAENESHFFLYRQYDDFRSTFNEMSLIMTEVVV